MQESVPITGTCDNSQACDSFFLLWPELHCAATALPAHAAVQLSTRGSMRQIYVTSVTEIPQLSICDLPFVMPHGVKILSWRGY